MTKINDWDAFNQKLGMSARQFVAKQANGMSDIDMARMFNKVGLRTDEDSVRNIRRRLGLAKTETGTERLVKVGKSPFVRYDAPPRIVGDVCVMGDLELPFHNDEFLNRVIELCQRWGIRKVVYNGDLLHNHELSGWEPNWEDGNSDGLSEAIYDKLLDIAKRLGKEGDEVRQLALETGLQAKTNPGGISEEWAYARPALRSMKDVFTEGATLILGNHEGRFLRNVDSPLNPADLVTLMTGNQEETWMKTAPYYYGIIESNGVKWRATHPKNTSVVPASVAAKLADKFHMNVLQAHNHLWGMVQSVSGQYIGVETGCMVDGLRLPYYAQRDTTRPVWQYGATIIRGGYCTLLHPIWSDWNRLMLA